MPVRRGSSSSRAVSSQPLTRRAGRGPHPSSFRTWRHQWRTHRSASPSQRRSRHLLATPSHIPNVRRQRKDRRRRNGRSQKSQSVVGANTAFQAPWAGKYKPGPAQSRAHANRRRAIQEESLQAHLGPSGHHATESCGHGAQSFQSHRLRG